MARPRPPFGMPTLSLPFKDLKEHYEIVVVGSGYGGGVAAARLAAAGHPVCVLERGKELHPGDYPSRFWDAFREFQLNMGGRHSGDDARLYDLHVGEGLSALVGCGLGGTSLINANVCLEADPRVYQAPQWPRAIRVGWSELDAGIQRALHMLDAKRLPEERSNLQKVKVLELEHEAMAAAFGGAPSITFPRLAINFETGRNRVGIEQGECRHCGDCISGCNYSAKNSVLMNYLPYARCFGAEIFTEVRVDSLQLERHRGKERWVVHFRRVGTRAEIFEAPPRFVTADLVVLAAGTLGSTRILLRSMREGLSLSGKALGTRFSGNGDTLSFAYDCDPEVNGIGLGDDRPEDEKPVGPCIAALSDLRHTQFFEDGIVIEDGSPPGALGRLMPIALAVMAFFGGDHASRWGRARARLRFLTSLPGWPRRGMALHTQTHLVMSHDAAGGTLELPDPEAPLVLRYIRGPGEEIFRSIDDKLRVAAGAIHGTHVPNPLWDSFFVNPLRRIWYWLSRRYRRPRRTKGRQLITVHPLGGCPMGEDAEHGVVNDRHQVFRESHGTNVYKSLYVMDGSVVPRALGVNPLLTIAGLAERACAHLLHDHFREALVDGEPGPLPRSSFEARRLGIRFSEKLTGFVVRPDGANQGLSNADEQKAFEDAERRGKESSQLARGGTPTNTLTVILEMEIDDVDRLIGDSDHLVAVTGTAEYPDLFGAPAIVLPGSKAQILTQSRDRVTCRTMRYRLRVVTRDGRRFLIAGDKWIRDHWWLWPLWRETRVLYTRVYELREGDDYEGVDERTDCVCAEGILWVRALDFVRQLRTQRSLNPQSWWERRHPVLRMSRFNRFFMRTMLEHGSPSFLPIEKTSRSTMRKRRSPLPEGVIHDVETDDLVKIRLTQYANTADGAHRRPVICSHGLGVSSRIFSIDTLGVTLLEHLLAEGFDVWLLDYRASIDLPEASFAEFTGDAIAKYDYPAAIKFVIEETGAKKVSLVVHCFGATTFFMAMLGGFVEPKDIASVVVSQIGPHLVTSPATRLKSGLDVGTLLWWLGWRLPNAYTDEGDRGWDRLMNFALRFWPVPRDERCRSDVCHRITFLYSQLYEHEQLDPATHAALGEMFGVANMRTLRHLAVMSRAGRIVDAEGEDVYLPHMADGRLGFPIRFLHGRRNACFHPSSTWISWRVLQDLHAKDPALHPGPYEWMPIEGFGHIDCIFGRDAATKVFPHISEFLNR